MTFVAFSLDTKGTKVVDTLAEKGHLLHLTKAVLVKGSKADLVVTDSEDASHVIAILDNKANRMVNLELIFNKTGHALSIKGEKGSTVHISGYQEPSGELYPSMDDSMDTEELARLNEECSDDCGALSRGDPKPCEEEDLEEDLSSSEGSDESTEEDVSPQKFLSTDAKESKRDASKLEALAELAKHANVAHDDSSEESSDESGSEDSDEVDIKKVLAETAKISSVTDEDDSSSGSDDDLDNDDDDDSSSSSTPESVNKLLLGLSENMPSDSDSFSVDLENLDPPTGVSSGSSEDDEPPALIKASSSSSKSKSKSPKAAASPKSSSSDGIETPSSKNSSPKESSSPSSKKRQRDDDSDDSSDTSSVKTPTAKVAKKQKVKESDKKETTAAKGKEAEKPAKGSKTTTTTTSSKGSTPEDQFETDLLKFLKANGRTALTVLGTKVKKPAAVKSKLGAFLKSRSSAFLVKDDQVESK